MRTLILAATTAIMFSGAAYANPAAVAGAQAIAGAGAIAGGGDGTGGSASTKTESTTIGAALGQAPTAVSPNSHCGKGTKFLFGALEWTDYSDKCFDRELAMIAAARGEWELANQWVERADAQ